MPASAFLPVTVDKSHLITIGERLYTESIELIRELVNNAYDADATEVRVTVGETWFGSRTTEPVSKIRGVRGDVGGDVARKV